MNEKTPPKNPVERMKAEARDVKVSGPVNADLVARWLQEQGLDGIPDMDLGPDTGEEGRPFLDGSTSFLFGFDRVVVKDNKIVALRSWPEKSPLSRPTLKVYDQVVVEGDSRGYVPSGHPPDSMATIVGFREPFIGHASDRIVLISNGETAGWVKPSNIAR